MVVEQRGISPFWCLVVVAGLPALAGCLSERSNTIARTARMREIEAERVTAQWQQRELGILRQLAADARDSIDDAKERSIAVSSELRAVLAALNHELDRLGVAEQDLAAAQARARQIEQELQPVRALEQQLVQQQQRHQQLLAQAAELEQQVQAAAAQLAQKQAELQPRLAELQTQLAAVAAVEQALAAARAAATAAGAALVPPEPAKK